MLADVRSGYVSLEMARRDYGVVIRERGRYLELDMNATNILRSDSLAHEVGEGRGEGNR